MAFRLQDELAGIIRNHQQVNDYERIVYKYVFISELNLPLLEDLDFEITDKSFIVHVIPDNLKFSQLKRIADAFDRFEIEFLPNSYNLIKLEFLLKGD